MPQISLSNYKMTVMEIKFFNIRSILLLSILFISIKMANSQVPASLEREIGSFYNELINAYKILRDEDIGKAVSRAASIRADLEKKSIEISKKIISLGLSESEYTRLGEKILLEPYMKEYMSVLMDKKLADRITSYPEIKKEFDALGRITDEFDNEAEEPVQSENAELVDLCSFNIEGNVPYKGSYTVKAERSDATAMIDENGLFTIEINGISGNLNMIIVLMSEKAEAGKYKWTMESQCYIEGILNEDEPKILMTSYYYDGYILLESVGNTGGIVKGTFSGKFFDETGSTETPLTVNGKFTAVRIRGSN